MAIFNRSHYEDVLVTRVHKLIDRAAWTARYERIRELRSELEASLLATAPEAIVLGAAAPRLPNTTAIALLAISAETQVIALDLDGVMVSAGAACSSGKVGPSHVLEAMGLGAEIAGSTIRNVSGTTARDRDTRSDTACRSRRPLAVRRSAASIDHPATSLGPR